MVGLGAVLDSSQEAHWSVAVCRVIEGDGVKVLDCDPTEYCPHLLHIGGTVTHQHPHQVREGLLILLGHLNNTQKLTQVCLLRVNNEDVVAKT